ncbi:MAG TPA: SRPBCC family protein [Acidimicrobiales bacterium]|nr:SRPBCC family protein [Acidimicrobiales bacterium]
MSGPTASVRRTALVPAPAAGVWAVLADFGALARWVTVVDHSCLLHEPDLAIGTARRVQRGRVTVLEVVDVLENGVRLGYRIEGLPAVLRSVRNEWELRSAAGGTEVAVTTTVDAGPRPPQQLVARLVARRLAKTSDSMLAGLAAHLADEAAPVA